MAPGITFRLSPGVWDARVARLVVCLGDRTTCCAGSTDKGTNVEISKSSCVLLSETPRVQNLVAKALGSADGVVYGGLQLRVLACGLGWPTGCFVRLRTDNASILVAVAYGTQSVGGLGLREQVARLHRACSCEGLQQSVNQHANSFADR
ncbi:uncharacterized protein BDZ83DRAFT_646291 [Colletotrichum acutatum]|uniref:Uncharacterized protein n=1 Tax=Glomerella acutata TaxID=27357 RepID=A0AAD8XPU9_GLOAC|nr:uncharacterized protein BDZ83DRAFT_646291 [Colletotrichum acutatum]KAK1731329.1 hypothetical protein BDZ83DRAFT_646291 [Colletotrichum acutatum]